MARLTARVVTIGGGGSWTVELANKYRVQRNPCFAWPWCVRSESADLMSLPPENGGPSFVRLVATRCVRPRAPHRFCDTSTDSTVPKIPVIARFVDLRQLPTPGTTFHKKQNRAYLIPTSSRL